MLWDIYDVVINKISGCMKSMYENAWIHELCLNTISIVNDNLVSYNYRKIIIRDI